MPIYVQQWNTLIFGRGEHFTMQLFCTNLNALFPELEKKEIYFIWGAIPGTYEVKADFKIPMLRCRMHFPTWSKKRVPNHKGLEGNAFQSGHGRQMRPQYIFVQIKHRVWADQCVCNLHRFSSEEDDWFPWVETFSFFSLKERAAWYLFI